MKRSSYEVTRLVNYAKKATAEELMEDYGVEIRSDGSVFDVVEQKKFCSIAEWAKSIVEDDEDEYDSNYRNKRGRFDDEDAYY